jgi:hypothetical protein
VPNKLPRQSHEAHFGRDLDENDTYCKAQLDSGKTQKVLQLRQLGLDEICPTPALGLEDVVDALSRDSPLEAQEQTQTQAREGVAGVYRAARM